YIMYIMTSCNKGGTIEYRSQFMPIKILDLVMGCKAYIMADVLRTSYRAHGDGILLSHFISAAAAVFSNFEYI
ncbi:hypothetical protein ACJX0J_026250, partial [Zea mays]